MANDGDKCPKCGRGILEIKPAGISKKSKKPYGAFLYCPVRPCDFTDWLPDNHPANRKPPDPVVPASQLTTAAPPAASSAPAPTTGVTPVIDIGQLMIPPARRERTGYDAVSEAISAAARAEGTHTVGDRIVMAKAFAEMLKAELGPTAAPAWPPPPGEDDDIPF